MSWECPLDFANTGRYSNPYTAAVEGSSTGEDVSSLQKWLNKLPNTRTNAAQLIKRGQLMVARAIDVGKKRGSLAESFTGTYYEKNKNTFDELEHGLKAQADRLGKGDESKDPKWDDVKRLFMRAVISYNGALEDKQYVDEKVNFYRELKDQFVRVVEKADEAMTFAKTNYLWIAGGVVIAGGFVLWMLTRPRVATIQGGHGEE